MAEKYYRQSRSEHNRIVREDESQKKSKIICHDKLQRPQEQHIRKCKTRSGVAWICKET